MTTKTIRADKATLKAALERNFENYTLSRDAEIEKRKREYREGIAKQFQSPTYETIACYKPAEESVRYRVALQRVEMHPEDVMEITEKEFKAWACDQWEGRY